ncbi:MAG: glycosyltransferase [Acidimicrobiales bacterium]
MPLARARVAIVHDYVSQRGGAERVVLSMLKAFPGALLYTGVYEPDETFPEFAQHDVRPLWTNRIGAVRRDHRKGLFLYPFAFQSLRVDADVVLCSSSGFAHGVRTTGRKIVYCYTPPRWLYDQAELYLSGWPRPVSAMMKVTGPAFRAWDRRAAASADQYLTTSTVVRQRVRVAYGRQAEIVPPPVAEFVTGCRSPVTVLEPHFVLCVARLLTYKNVDKVIVAFEDLPDKRLVVVGDGPEAGRLAALAGANVTLLPEVDDAQLAWLYANCTGVVSAAHEDFGLTVVEAAACGKPVAVLRAGGFLDTVTEGETGVFFDEPEARSIAKAVEQLFEGVWDITEDRAGEAYFTEDWFAEQLRETLFAAAASGPGAPLAS